MGKAITAMALTVITSGTGEGYGALIGLDRILDSVN